MDTDPSSTRFPWNIQREGRAWTGDEWDARRELTPEKIEMMRGKLFWCDEDRLAMLALLLENVGVDKAIRLGDPRVWQEAIMVLMGELRRGKSRDRRQPMSTIDRFLPHPGIANPDSLVDADVLQQEREHRQAVFLAPEEPAADQLDLLGRELSRAFHSSPVQARPSRRMSQGNRVGIGVGRHERVSSQGKGPAQARCTRRFPSSAPSPTSPE